MFENKHNNLSTLAFFNYLCILHRLSLQLTMMNLFPADLLWTLNVELEGFFKLRHDISQSTFKYLALH